MSGPTAPRPIVVAMRTRRFIQLDTAELASKVLSKFNLQNHPRRLVPDGDRFQYLPGGG